MYSFDSKTKTINTDELPALFDAIEALMQQVEQLTNEAASDHFAAFAAQMREKFGADEIAFDEPYLPELTASLSLRFLDKIDRLIETLTRALTEDSFRTTIFDFNAPLLPQMENRLTLETVRHSLEAKQELDRIRQQNFGVKKYIWQTAGDDRVRASHGELEGSIRLWDDGSLLPGQDPGCRCSGEPVVEGSSTPTVQVAVLGLARAAILLAAKLKASADKLKKGREAAKKIPVAKPKLPKPKPKKPPTGKIFERPKNVPKDWIKKPSNKGEGTKYVDPKNPHSYVRISRGKPESSNPGQRVDHVRWQKNGQSLDKNGNPVSTQSQESHIPLDKFKFKLGLFE